MHFTNIHHLTRLCLIFSGIISCVTGASNTHTCNCNCGDRYSYGKLLDGHHNNSCQPKRAGQLKFTDGRLFVCTGNEWKALQYVNESSTTPNVSYRSKAPNVPYRSKAPNVRVPYGSKAKPGFSCKDIKTKNGKQNGIYWIRLSDKETSFPVYCDMVAGGWTMVFKAVAGVDKNAYSSYTSGQTSSEKVFAALEVTNRHFDHYKNRIVLKWKNFGASEARVVLYEGGKLMKESKFNAKGSDKLNWFSISRLSQSSWFDLRSQPKNYFSIAGEPTHGRRFFINRNYGGCSVDNGWMMVVTGHICSWETRFLPTKNVILYSKKPVYTNWNAYSNVGVADVMAVYLR